MEEFISYLGAAISAVAAIVAWGSNLNMKKYELKQKHISKILEKRFEAYPELWVQLGEFTSSIDQSNFKDKTKQLRIDINRHYIRNGIFYSNDVQREIDSVLKNIDHYLEDNNILNIPIQNFAKSVNGLRTLLKDDLGAYGEMAAQIRNNA